MKQFVLIIELPDDCDSRGVKEQAEELMGDLLAEEGGKIISCQERKIKK